MDWGSLSEDRLDSLIVDCERQVGVLRAVQLAAIAEKRRRGSHRVDGHRSILDWVAARADVSSETARNLCWTATRLAEAPDVAEDLVSGGLSFDRAGLLARLPVEHRSDHQGFDIGQLQARVAHYRRLTRARERKTGNGYLHFTQTDTATHLWGALTGIDGRIVEKAVDQRADEIIPDSVRLPVAERRAAALAAICHDSLYTTSPDHQTTTPVEVCVTVDARTATETNAETGVRVLAGPRIGPKALQAIICDGIVSVVGISEEGQPLALGRKTRTVDPKLRRYVLDRDQGCTQEGCSSRYRLEVHHLKPWSYQGRTDPDNLITLCWYHHHISIHQQGLQPHRLSPSRIRLKRPR